MARKTAMRKQPSVSIALPESEKQRLGGIAQGVIPGKPSAPPKRLSPGVYRSAQGGLVNSKGRALPGQKQPSLIEGALAGAGRNANEMMQRPQMPPQAPEQLPLGMGPLEQGNQQFMPGRPQQWRQPAPLGMGQGQFPGFGNMQRQPAYMPFPQQMPQMDMQQFLQQYQYNNAFNQQPGSVSGMLQQGGQQQPQAPMMNGVVPPPKGY
jgi:hypothetical protein